MQGLICNIRGFGLYERCCQERLPLNPPSSRVETIANGANHTEQVEISANAAKLTTLGDMFPTWEREALDPPSSRVETIANGANHTEQVEISANAAKLTTLGDMFPTWEREALEDVLTQCNGSVEEAIELLLQWHKGNPSFGSASTPVCPFSAPKDDRVFQKRSLYDRIMAKRLQRKAGGNTLAGVAEMAMKMKRIADLWRHHAGEHGEASRSNGAAAAHSPRAHANLSHEEQIRQGKELLRQRCVFLGLEQHEIDDDGNCQYRAISYELYGTQDSHEYIRSQTVAYIRNHGLYRDVYGEDWERELEKIETPGEWGSELTLQAAAERFAIKIHVVQSTEENWLLLYSPTGGVEVAREIFLTYVAPVHYNTIALLR